MSAGRDDVREAASSDGSGRADAEVSGSGPLEVGARDRAEATKIGRYAILTLLGEGGMGRVYAVYDDQLDRRIALKVVKLGSSGEAQRRMLREAQALAKVNHPNVVSVFEVGAHEGQLFVAMEYVDGADLKRWLDAQSRSAREILDVYLQAGRGLAAVHAQGLVHRDFKPDNAVVGHDGRVRVLDFGLAARDGADAAGTLVPEPKASGALDIALTRTGAVLGTPAYMPPEQFRGGVVDARSDQFSYCVAIWEALYGSRPYDGRTRAELFHAIARGQRTDPGRTEVWAGLRPVLERGLSPDPNDRWPDMTALLGQLQRYGGRPRGRAVKVGLLGLGATAAAIAFGIVRLRDDLDQMQGQVQASERVAAVEQSNALAATRAKADAVVAMQNALLISRAVLFESVPTEATAMLREVAATDPHEVFGWDAAAQRVRLQRRDLRAVLVGHTEPLKQAWFLPGGDQVVTASADGTVRVFDADGTVERTLDAEHEGELFATALSPDGARVATGSLDGEVRIFSLDGSEPPAVLTTHRLGVFALEFSPDGERVLSASLDGTARVVRADGSGTPVDLTGHTAPVVAARFDATGTHVATASWDRTARVFDAEGGEAPVVLDGHTEDVIAVAFSPDGSHVATGSMDGTARIFDARGGRAAEVLIEDAEAVSSVVFSPDGALLATVCDDGRTRIARTDGSRAPVVLDHGTGPLSISFSPDGARLVVAGADGHARVFQADGQGPTTVLGGHTLEVVAASFSDDGDKVVTASNDSTARVYSLTDPSPVSVLAGHTDVVASAAFSPDGTRIATASHDRTVRLFAPDGATPPVVLTGHEGRIVSVAFSPDGTQIVTASWDETVRIFDADGDGASRILARHRTKANDAHFSPDGTKVVTASSDTTARIVRVDGTGEPVVLSDHGGAVASARFSPDATLVVTGAADKMARVFSSEGGDALLEFPHPDVVWDAAFSPDGTRIVTACFDDIARIFDADGTGEPIELRGSGGWLFEVAFSPDGNYVVAASEKSAAFVFRADGTGTPTVLSGHDARVFSAEFSPDGSQIITGSQDHTARVYATAELGLDLRTVLWRTPFCHSPRRRRELLAEPEDVARAHHERCLDLVQICTTRPYSACHTRVTAAFGQ